MMGEVKSVKVDNWGVFFLQKLQNFFNKTDYCDLTLQFRDNSQLKVHRLVLSACTDYFNVLEQTCEIVDDALIMPNEFQADVVVPIVNFMYTGTLEFELKMYGKLLRTAKEMNMTVLLKLLEAHRRTMENVNRAQRPPSPLGVRRTRKLPLQVSPQRAELQTATATTTTNRNVPQVAQQFLRSGSGITITQRSPNSSSLLRTNTGGAQQQRQYETSPQAQITIKQETAPSPFEQLRKGGFNNNIKRPAVSSILSPPAKKPNLEDVKEFAEQQRMRKQIAAEFGEDNEYDGMMDDVDIHADDDDDEMPQTSQQALSAKQQQQTAYESTTQTATTTRVEHGSATIIFKQETPDQQPTIIVKDSSSTKLNHAKIISEVLRQYPHLMKGQKNIKLKIMPNSTAGGGSGGGGGAVAANTASNVHAQKVMKKETIDGAAVTQRKSVETQQPQQQQQRKVLTQISNATRTTAAQTQHVQKEQPATIQKAGAAEVAASQATPAQSSTAEPQKRRIDSKTMHALIALGAENTTGPWLCLRCGVNNRPISIPSYRGFRRHLINTHKEAIDPALCEYCGWRSQNDRELHFHTQIQHAVVSTLYTFPECNLCNELFPIYEDLNAHLESAHANTKQQCIYCNRYFAQEQQLYAHLRTQHKAQALEDGIIDDTAEEFYEAQAQAEPVAAAASVKKESKVKILSNISLPSTSPMLKLEPAPVAVQQTEAITQAQEYLQSTTTTTTVTDESEIKFVGPDGTEVELTDEQRKEILAQLNQQEHATGGVVMVLNEQEHVEETLDAAEKINDEIDNAAEVKSADTEESLPEEELHEEGDPDATSMPEDYDDSQIYQELNSQGATGSESGKKSVTEHLEESKESADNLEWAENLVSEHDRETSDANEEEKTKTPKLSDKLKELTCDWTEDENEDDEEIDNATAKSPAKEPEIKENNNVNITEETEIKEHVEEKTNTVQHVLEADDIDLALESMHKETPTEEITAAQTSALDAETAIETVAAAAVEETITQAITNINEAEVIEKMDVSETEGPAAAVATTTTAEEQHEAAADENNLLLVKEEKTDDDNVDQEFLKESPVRPKTAPAATATAVVSGEVTDLEADNIRKTLLAELIAEADSGTHEEEEEVEELVEETENKNIKEENVAAEATKETSVAADDAINAVEKVVTETTEIEDKPKDVAAANAADVSSDAAAAVENDAEKPTTSIENTTSGNGADKVKSLISEWADDDDDDKVKEEL